MDKIMADEDAERVQLFAREGATVTADLELARTNAAEVSRQVTPKHNGQSVNCASNTSRRIKRHEKWQVLLPTDMLIILLE
jgi:hypothetical protein